MQKKKEGFGLTETCRKREITRCSTLSWAISMTNALLPGTRGLSNVPELTVEGGRGDKYKSGDKISLENGKE